MTKKASNISNLRDNLKERHNRYKSKGLYRYVGINVLKIIIVYGIFVVLLFFVSKYLLDFNIIFDYFLKRFSDTFTLVLFFISESFLGLVPVDLFVLWAVKFETPFFYLALLGILSYAGGIISYLIGHLISRMPKIRAYTERKLQNYILFVRKWGGAFIIIAALFPFTPFSMVVIALTLLKYPFRLYLIYGAARLVRFVIQGIIFFDVINVDNWITLFIS